MGTDEHFDLGTWIALSAIIISFAIVIVIIVLSTLNKIIIGGDLTNGINITIEIGIGLFIAIAIFLHSKYQQTRAEMLLLKVKSFNEEIVKQRSSMRDIYRKTILTCLEEIWKRDELILLNIRTYVADETEQTIGMKPVDEVIETYKTQLLQYIEQLNTLAVLSSSVLESEIIAPLIELKRELEDNVVQKGTFAASHPWSAIMWRIDKFVKKYYPADIDKFNIKNVEKLLHEGLKKEIQEGRIKK